MCPEKQIEEMAKITHDGCAVVRATNQCKGEDCLDCAAITLYNAGYRKASEIFEEIEKLTASVYNDFMFNRDGVGMNAHYVVQFSDELDIAIAELKKKYTEER